MNERVCLRVWNFRTKQNLNNEHIQRYQFCLFFPRYTKMFQIQTWLKIHDNNIWKFCKNLAFIPYKTVTDFDWNELRFITKKKMFSLYWKYQIFCQWTLCHWSFVVDSSTCSIAHCKKYLNFKTGLKMRHVTPSTLT
jgi:hypothetical protein